MPNGKRQDAITLTFSKKNKDVFNLVTKMKEEDENFVQTDYICEAVRFFNKYKDSVDKMLDTDMVNKLIETKLAMLNIQKYSIEEESKAEKNKEIVFMDKKTLESNIEDVDIEDD